MSHKAADHALEGIAIVGMSGRFPGARDLEEYWSNLCRGVEGIRSFSRDELAAAGVPPGVIDHPSYVHASGYVGGFESFDADFFDFNPADALLLDPHHRLFLEHSWMALEDAGYDPFSYEGAIGVYGGMGPLTYLTQHLAPNPEVRRTASPLQLRIYNDKDFLASLTAYKLNLQGPSATVQTACATSLVTTCMACQSLLGYHCDMAISGGVALVPPGYFAHEGVFSTDGHCRAFDARAGGTVAGAGIGVIVLKRLDRALADGDSIHAVLRGWAFNNDGALKVGYTAPGVDGQAEAIEMAQAMAGFGADTITYVEAHGTGTPLGDQIEVAALTEVFRESTDKRGFCALGSVKTSIGHLDAAGGVAGLIKTVLAIEHGFLPPSLHFETPNPQIDFASSPFYVQDQPEVWRSEGPRRAGVSAFAVGGVNAHLVLEEAPPPEPTGPSRAWQILPLSARGVDALEKATGRLTTYLHGDRPSPDGTESSEWQPAALPDVAFTLQIGRRAFEHRRVLVCRDSEDALAVLGTRDPQRLLSGTVRERGRPVAFLFPGLGNHYVGMARGLYEAEEAFREVLDEAAERLEPRLGVDFRGLLHPAEPAAGETRAGLAAMLGRAGDEAPAGELVRTRLAQPVVFAVEYALARLLRSWGIEPDGMFGYSVGEYVAACLAGVFELDDALALVALRAQMIDSLPAGSMLAVPLAEAELGPLLNDDLSVCAVNTPQVTVVGGSTAAVEALARRLEEQGEICRTLQTTHAFHSHMMWPIVEEFRRLVAEVELRPPEIPFVSSATGHWITARQATDPGYWADHLREPIRYAGAVATLWRDNERILLEVGPGQTLTSWALQTGEGSDPHSRLTLPTMRHAYEKKDDQQILLTALGRLWLAGVEVDWSAFSAGERRRRVPLPTYSFERRRYWVEASLHRPDAAAPASEAPPSEAPAEELRKVENLRRWLYLPVWKPETDLAERRANAAPRSWLLFVDPRGIGLKLAERLEEAGHEVFLVAAGRRFEKVEEGAYTVDPCDPDGYAELLADLRERGLACERVVHGWTLGESPPAAGETFEKGLLSLVFLAQALNASPVPRRLVVVSSHLHQVTGGDELFPERALVLGPCAVLPLEYPELECRSVEVALPAPSSRLEGRLLERLYRDLVAEDEAERLVAYRGIRRWTRSFEPVRLSEAADPKSEGCLRRRGTYVITGGLGGLGLTIAEELARRAAARLVLVGRSPFPTDEVWKSWLAEHPPSDPVSRRIRRLTALRNLGAEVLVVSADVTDLAALRQLRERTLERFGAVHGLIHAAGVPPGGLAEGQTRQQLEAVLAPKVTGTRLLHEVFAEDRPDFLMLCSSLTAITGSYGLVDHTSANAFLDAWAQAAATDGTIPTISVNWDAWLEVGQAAAAAAAHGLTEGFDEELLHVPEHPLLDACVFDSGERVVYRCELSPDSHWLLGEHRLGSLGVMPGTGHLELVRAAWEDRFGPGGVELREVLFQAPLLVAAGSSREVRLTFEKSAEEQGAFFDFVLQSRPSGGGSWTRHVEGQAGPAEDPPSAREPAELEPIRRRCAPPERLGTLAGGGGDRPAFTFGPHWRHLTAEIRRGSREGLLTLELDPRFAAEPEVYKLHPTLLDSATGAVQYLAGGTSFLPLLYGRLRFWRPLPARVHGHLRLDGATADGETLAGDVTLLDDTGQPLVEIEGFTLRRVDPEQVADAVPERAEREAGNPQEPFGIRPPEGAEVFLRLLALTDRTPQVLVSTLPVPRRWEVAPATSVADEQLLARLERPGSKAGRSGSRPALATQFVAPRNAREKEIAEVFAELLGLREVGVHDNFFDLGGDSLLATRMIGLVEERFGARLSLRAVFEAPSVAELASALDEPSGSATAGAGKLVRQAGSGPFPLSYSQRQIWLFERLRPGTPAYNVPGVLQLSGELRTSLLRRAFDELMERQDQLRASFSVVGEQPVQTLPDDVRCPFTVVDLAGLGPRRRRVQEALLTRRETLRPFDLGGGPFLRVVLLRLTATDHVLVTNVHHSICDHLSQMLMVREVAVLYGAFHGGLPSPLGPLPLRFVDYVVWLERFMGEERTNAQISYWKEELAGARHTLDLPLDSPRPTVQSLRGARVDLPLPKELDESLRGLLEAHEGTSLFMVLLTAFYVLLYRHSGQEDVLVGSPVTGRNVKGVESVIGFFTNVLILRGRLGGDPTLGQLLERVRRCAMGAYDHQELPFEKLLAELGVERDPSRSPVFQVMLVLQQDPREELEIPELTLTPAQGMGRGSSKYDLTLFVFEGSDGLRDMAIEYNPDLFTERRMERWCRDYRGCLESIVEDEERPLSKATDLLRREARRQTASLGRKKLKKIQDNDTGLPQRQTVHTP